MKKIIRTSMVSVGILVGSVLAGTSTVTGPVKSIQTRSQNYGVDYATYIRIDVSGYVRSYKIDPQDAKSKDLLSTALSAKTTGESITIGFNDAACGIPNDYCTIQYIEY